jgi:putative oxidoreductase
MEHFMEGHSMFGKISRGPERLARNVVLIRSMLGVVFVSEGIQKFLFPIELGTGRFLKIGIPAPDLLAPFVGVVEIVFGVLILIGLASRLAAIPLIVDMAVAVSTTKIPILMQSGFWKMMHEARVDFCMLTGLVFVLLVGSGEWSVDSREARRRRRGSEEQGVVLPPDPQ